jgi:hypothetical protein
MASTAPTTPETMVTLKVNYEGSTRRFKLPLRDMGASTLEEKVCHFDLLRCLTASLAPNTFHDKIIIIYTARSPLFLLLQLLSFSTSLVFLADADI